MELFSQLLLCLLVADFFSGVIHWAEDTYAVPGMWGKWFDDVVVSPNIAHHKAPGKIAKSTYWDNIRVSTLFASLSLVVLVVFQITAWQAYLVVLLAAQMNQTHAWAHMRKVPRWVGILQQMGVIQSTEHHSQHHKSPYSMRFCTGTNLLNPILDAVRFWSLLEQVILKLFGVCPKRGSVERGGY